MSATLQKTICHGLVATFFVGLVGLSATHAQTPPSPPPPPAPAPAPAPPPATPPAPSPGPVSNPTPSGSNSLVNPLKNIDSIEGFLLAVIDIILVFAIPLIVLFVMYSGFRLVIARGNTTEVEKAKQQFTWAVVGGVIVLGAKIVVEVIQGTVETFK